VLDNIPFKCRVVSEQFKAQTWDDFQLGEVSYSSHLPLAAADGLVALYDPTEELLAFKGPKLWFTTEPSWHHHFHSHPIGRRLVRELDLSERAFYGHPWASNRIAHPTFRGPLTTPRIGGCRDAAVACVNNFGGRLWFLKRQFNLRNRFVLSPLVELFGSSLSWSRFRHFPAFWLVGHPKNFQGRASPGEGYYDNEHIEFISRYKVAICLENCAEPHYFTEKFVNAARAGCIPVYHAHPTVKERFLAGAKWVDPADFSFSAKRTIQYALNQDQAEFRSINDAWLLSSILEDTDDRKVFSKLHAIISRKLKPKSL
jgi:hypothetical protein